MTYNEFRSQPDLIEKANSILRDPVVVLMIEAIASEPPARSFPLPAIGSSADDKAMALGQQYGFQFFHDRLLSLGVPIPQTQELVAKYAPPE